MRRRAVWILATIITLLGLLWLALPRLAGFALSRFLNVPGLEQLSVSFDSLSFSQATIRELSLRYRTETGTILQLTATDISLAYDASEQRAQNIRVAAASVTLTPSSTAPTEPWTVIALPRLPFDTLTVDQLRLTLSQQADTLSQSLALQLHQDDSKRLLLKLDHANHHIELSLAEAAQLLHATMQWQQGGDRLADITVELAAMPNQQPVALTGTIDLSLLAEWNRLLNLPALPFTATGQATTTATIQLGETQASWRQAEAGLEFSDTHIKHVDGELTTAGTLSVSATPEKISLIAAPGWQLQVTSAEPAFGTLRTTLSAPYELSWSPGQNADSFGSLHSETTLPLHWQSTSWGEWQLQLSAVDLQLQPTGVPRGALTMTVAGTVNTLQIASVSAQKFSADGTLAIQLDDAIRVTSIAPVQLRAEQLLLQTKTPWQLTQAALHWRGSAQLHAPDGSWQLAKLDGQLAGKKLRATQAQTRVELTDWQLKLQLQRHWQGRLTAATASHEQAGSVIKAGPLAVKIDRYDPALSQGQFHINAEQVQHSAIADWPRPALNSAVELKGEALSFSGDMRSHGNALLQFRGQHNLASERGNAAVNWQHELKTLDQALQPRPRALTPLAQLLGQDRGDLQLNWHLQEAAQGLRASGRLQVENAGLQWDKASANGLAVDLQLSALQPLQGSMRVQLPSAQLAAGIPVQDSVLALTLNAEALQLQQLQANLLGGRWHAVAQQLPRSPSATALPIHVEGIELSQILALVDVEGLTGNGTLDGQLPLIYDAEGVAVRDGELHSRGAGTLKYAPAMALGDNPGLLALRDFRYERLRVMLNYLPNGQYRIQLKLDGHNPNFYSGYPIAFTVNLNGELPGLFRAALLSGDFNQHVLQQLQSGELK